MWKSKKNNLHDKHATIQRLFKEEKSQLTPDKLVFNIFRRSIFDNPSWKGI